MAIELGAGDWEARFVCDFCKQSIDSVADAKWVEGRGDNSGIVVFRPSLDRPPTEFFLAHKLRCDPRYNDTDSKSAWDTCWMPLEIFLEELTVSLKGKTAAAK